ncbi:hypothetical protein ANCCAN_26465 [Ancylostoma caninum]|uniref:Uncharacterized protein n=1 Tax=Ancylostoma caninum TaxID=29170 RepID=A0A368F8A5_ANCCA|nr:hypothetical protein ANCCAN_26465 [Ancylostoma caninum]
MDLWPLPRVNGRSANRTCGKAYKEHYVMYVPTSSMRLMENGCLTIESRNERGKRVKGLQRMIPLTRRTSRLQSLRLISNSMHIACFLLYLSPHWQLIFSY